MPGGLKQCRQAQEQLDSAISSVLRAEQQLRENAREVSVHPPPPPPPLPSQNGAVKHSLAHLHTG